MTAPERVRLAELLATLSVATDVGLGVPPETAIRKTFVAQAVAAELRLDAATRADLYWATLLRSVACTGFAHELGEQVGDEFEAARAVELVEQTGPADALDAFVVAADCEGMASFTRRLPVGPGVGAALQQVFERWDGRGAPRGLAGEAMGAAARVLVLADQVEAFHRLRGRAATVAMAQVRSEGWFDPGCVAAFLSCADDVFDVLEQGAAWEAALTAEPVPQVTLPPWGVEDVAAVFADFADMKSPWLLGHSTRVADLATAAAERLGLDGDQRTALRRAALLHDLGRVAVPARIWDKPGALSPAEWEQVRLHAYYTERVLRGSPLLAPLAAVAGAHHERLDGTGYPRGVVRMDAAAGVLAAADVYDALTSARPHRPALPPDRAGAEMEAAARAGALDADAAAAICAVAGSPIAPVVRVWPAGLTDREVDVLRLLARGRSEREIAAELGIAKGTVHTHVTHCYQKAGVSTRVGIALFALEHRLV